MRYSDHEQRQMDIKSGEELDRRAAERKEKAKRPVCGLCGEPMPPGEEMFQYHGYSGPCPKDLPQKDSRP